MQLVVAACVMTALASLKSVAASNASAADRGDAFRARVGRRVWVDVDRWSEELEVPQQAQSHA